MWWSDFPQWPACFVGFTVLGEMISEFFSDSPCSLQDGHNLSCCRYPSPVIQGLLCFLSKTANFSHDMYLELNLISPLSWLPGIVFHSGIFSSWNFSSRGHSTYKLEYPRAWMESHSVRIILLHHAMCKDMPSWAEERKACSHFSTFCLVPDWIGK